MKTAIQTAIVAGVIFGLVAAFLIGLARMAHATPEAVGVAAEFADLDADLDRLEARMVQAHGIVRHWERLQARHEQATPIVCEQMAEVALTWEVR